MDNSSLHSSHESATTQQASVPRRNMETIQEELRLVQSKLAEPPPVAEYIRDSSKQLLSSFAQLLSINTDFLSAWTTPYSKRRSPERNIAASPQSTDQPENTPTISQPTSLQPFSRASVTAWHIALIFLLWIISTAPDTIAGIKTILFSVAIIFIGAIVVTWQLEQYWNELANLANRERSLQIEHHLASLTVAIEELTRSFGHSTADATELSQLRPQGQIPTTITETADRIAGSTEDVLPANSASIKGDDNGGTSRRRDK
jgi:hypothetical protein